MKIGELFFNLGFHADSMKLKDFGKAVADLNMSSILTAGSFGALYEGAKQLVDLAHGLGDSVNIFTKETGASGDELQRWSTVAHDAGSSAEAMKQNLSAIRKAMDDVHAGIAPNQNWGRLGLFGMLQTETDPTKLLNPMLEGLRKYSDEKRRIILDSLVGNQSLFLIDKQFPGSKLAEALRNVSVLSPEELAKINDNMILMSQTADKIKVIFAELGTSILPGINDLLNQVNSTLIKMGESRLLKDVLWLVENIVIGGVGDLKIAGGGLEKLYRYGLPSTWKGIGRGEISMGNPLYGITHLDRLGEEKAPVVQHNQIVIQGSHDPEATARAVDEHLSKQISHARANGSTGVQ